MITQTIVNGLLLGGLFGIASIGFSIVWGVMGVINLAHTAFITVGAYIALSMFAEWTACRNRRRSSRVSLWTMRPAPSALDHPD